MSQISPPIRIALVAAIAFLGVWAMFLRPTAEEPLVAADPAAATSSAPSDSAAGEAVAGANLSAQNADARAAAIADGTAAPVPDAATTPATTPAAAVTAAGPGEPSPEALAALPRDVARAVRRDQVVALLFWNRKAADDRRVRRSLAEIGDYDGKVFVKAARVGDIARYAPITRGVDVQQAPTIVVVDRDLRAERLVGFVARGTIRQALSDAVRAGR